MCEWLGLRPTDIKWKEKILTVMKREREKKRVGVCVCVFVCVCER